ncbi:hypothetical protein H4R33_004096 [Dimargaris cristalligena]|nr:hypothetical protein H4R33_004096 [Dimargaris cristalligena]
MVLALGVGCTRAEQSATKTVVVKEVVVVKKVVATKKVPTVKKIATVPKTSPSASSRTTAAAPVSTPTSTPSSLPVLKKSKPSAINGDNILSEVHLCKFLQVFNKFRASRRLPAAVSVSSLTMVAQTTANRMAEVGKQTHDNPVPLLSRLTNSGANVGWASENILDYGQNEQQALDEFIGSPAHLKAMEDTRLNAIGFAGNGPNMSLVMAQIKDLEVQPQLAC